MKNSIRLAAKEVGGNGIIVVDLRLTGERVDSSVLSFGIQRKFQDSIPFTIAGGGVIDFGTAYDLQQYGQTDLFRTKIAVGFEIHWEAHERQERYRVEETLCF